MLGWIALTLMLLLIGGVRASGGPLVATRGTIALVIQAARPKPTLSIPAGIRGEPFTLMAQRLRAWCFGRPHSCGARAGPLDDGSRLDRRAKLSA